MSWKDILKAEGNEITEWGYDGPHFDHSKYRFKEVPREKLPLDAPLVKRTLEKIQEACEFLVISVVLGPRTYQKIKDTELVVEEIQQEAEQESKKPKQKRPSQETIGQPDE